MTIKEIEKLSGLSRSMIRFYEKEELIKPKRNEENGYRDYSNNDLENIKKIAFLRTLGLSVEQIRKVIRNEVDFIKVIKRQKAELEKQESELHNMQILCDSVINSHNNYDELKVEEYIEGLENYWNHNKNVLKLDTVGFVYLWGGFAFWIIMTILSLFIAVLSIRFLPEEIPVQWSNGEPSTLVNKLFIFAFPIICLLIKFALRPFIWRWFSQHFICTDDMIDYTVNSLCFISIAVEIFIIYSSNNGSARIEVLLLILGMILVGIPIYVYARLSKYNKMIR